MLRPLKVFDRAVRVLAVAYGGLGSVDALPAVRDELVALEARDCRRVAAVLAWLAFDGRPDPLAWVERLEGQAARTRETDALEEAWIASPEEPGGEGGVG